MFTVFNLSTTRHHQRVSEHLFICICSQLAFTLRLISLIFVHSFTFVSYALGSGFLLHGAQAFLAIHVYLRLRGTVVELEISLTFLTGVFRMCVEVIFQII